MGRTRAILGMVLAAGLVVACASAPLSPLATCERDLQVSFELEGSDVVVGTRFPVEFHLHNSGTTTIEACFGSAFEVTFWNGKQAQGWANTSDHPSCEQPFALEPGARISRGYVATVPNISAGPATLAGWVQLVDPHRCDKYGCDRLRVRAQHSLKVNVLSNENIRRAG
jgi:hypothetical protein